MSQSRENLRTDRRTDGRKEGQTGRPYLIELFRQWPGVQQNVLNVRFYHVCLEMSSSCSTSEARLITKKWHLYVELTISIQLKRAQLTLPL